MRFAPACLSDESDQRVGELRRRLDDFYATITDYDAFAESNFKPEFWDPIVEALRSRAATGRPCRLLEFGAGRTGFPAYLGELRARVRIEAQDVTPQNVDHLGAHCDAVHVGDLATVRGPFDVIFSTFVWEHLTNPAEALKHLLSILAPGGSLFIACPRYDFPLYLSPSCRHYSRARRIAIAAWVQWRRLAVRLGAQPDFLIHLDPCLFHRPWFRDADAIHWVSWWDLRGALPPGYRIRRLRLPARGLAYRFWERFLLMFVEIQAPASDPPAAIYTDPSRGSGVL